MENDFNRWAIVFEASGTVSDGPASEPHEPKEGSE